VPVDGVSARAPCVVVSMRSRAVGVVGVAGSSISVIAPLTGV
jgi:hypothetical protein